MPNENCLKGISCPKCESEGPFNIRVSTMICVHDDGTDNEYGDLDWGDDSEIICNDCGHRGIVKEFRSIVEEIVTEFTRKEIREALKAHNSGKEDACFNEAYNETNGLGSMRARALIRSVIYCHNGLMSDRKTKITMREIEEFARNSLGDVKIV